jgi:hypothetical protein
MAQDSAAADCVRHLCLQRRVVVALPAGNAEQAAAGNHRRRRKFLLSNE